MTFSGGTWSPVGSPGSSADKAHYTSLALHPTTGAPYVAFQDSTHGDKATVITFG